MGDADLANSLLSRTLNRRLLVEALAVAMAVALADTVAVSAPAPPTQQEYNYVLALLRDKIAPATTDRVATAAIKSAARMVKYLANEHQYGDAIGFAAVQDLSTLLGVQSTSKESLDTQLCECVSQGRIDEVALLRYFCRQAARETQLAAPAMGALATRKLPSFE